MIKETWIYLNSTWKFVIIHYDYEKVNRFIFSEEYLSVSSKKIVKIKIISRDLNEFDDWILLYYGQNEQGNESEHTKTKDFYQE